MQGGQKMAEFEYIKMDYSLDTEERIEKVKEIIESTPPERLTPYYLEQLTKYIVISTDKKERNEKPRMTEGKEKKKERERKEKRKEEEYGKEKEGRKSRKRKYGFFRNMSKALGKGQMMKICCERRGEGI